VAVLHRVVAGGGTPAASDDEVSAGRWLRGAVRSDNARGPAVAPDGSALYYVVPLQNLNGLLDYELRAARPEGGHQAPGPHLGERIPIWQGLHPVISRDGKSLVVPLDDGLGTNIWVVSPLTESYGRLRILIRSAHSSRGEFPGRRTGSGCLPRWERAMPISCRWMDS